MSWQQDIAKDQREHFANLLREGGKGWHPYVLDAAESLVRSDPMMHAGLVAAVEKQIGEKSVRSARRALERFQKAEEASEVFTIPRGYGMYSQPEKKGRR